jgi:hypothetical protein
LWGREGMFNEDLKTFIVKIKRGGGKIMEMSLLRKEELELKLGFTKTLTNFLRSFLSWL